LGMVDVTSMVRGRGRGMVVRYLQINSECDTHFYCISALDFM
jgi:hypothetical protein